MKSADNHAPLLCNQSGRDCWLSRATGRSIDSFIAIGNRQNKLGEKRGSRNESQRAASNVPTLISVQVTFSRRLFVNVCQCCRWKDEKWRPLYLDLLHFSWYIYKCDEVGEWRPFFFCARSMNNDPSPFCRRRPTTSLAKEEKGKSFNCPNLRFPICCRQWLHRCASNSFVPSPTGKIIWKKFHTNSSENQRD